MPVHTLDPNLDFEVFTQLKPDWIIGLDEAGAGCLAGPLSVAAFAIKVCEESKALKTPDYNVVINDSKKLSEKQREEAFSFIEKLNPDLVRLNILEVSIQKIETANIYWARMNAFEELIFEMSSVLKGTCVFIVDGPRMHRSSDSLKNGVSEFPEHVFAYPKADSKFFTVASAAILAKVTRDRMMTKAAALYPQYLWSKNKGYATADHRQAIAQHGLCPLHRPSFCTKIASATLDGSEKSQGT